VIQFCPFSKKFALQFIDVNKSSSVHFLLQNTPNTIQLDLGRVSSVATNQECVEQIIVPYLGITLLNCFSKMFKIVQFYYRAMHFSAKRGIAIACRLSVRPSVRPSVCNVGEL